MATRMRPDGTVTFIDAQGRRYRAFATAIEWQAETMPPGPWLRRGTEYVTDTGTPIDHDPDSGRYCLPSGETLSPATD